MFIHSALLENFKKILHLEIKAEGNHIVLVGMNGTCKTAVLEALLTLMFGKKLLPNDPVRHGAESSLIECGICNDKGDKVAYKIKSRITDNNFSLTVSTFTPGGNEMVVKKPTEFLSTIVTRDFIDPDEFVRKGGKDRIAMLYKLIPSLQTKINELEKDYDEEKFNRSQINIDKKKLESQLLNYPFTKGLPESEEDPAVILEELKAAGIHNAKKDEMLNEMQSIDRDMDNSNEMALQAAGEIKALEQQIANKKRLVDEMAAKVDECAAMKAEISNQIDGFVSMDVQSIEDRLSKLNETNKAIRTNQKHNAIQKELSDKAVEYSAGLTRMREIEDKKISVYRDVEMPVDGLEVGVSDITFPDPNNGERVSFGSLSTGQKVRVAVGILAKFLPPPEEGLRCMVINDANALDKKNYTAMLEAADENNIQLLMHKTAFETESNELEIIIEGADEK